MAEHLRFDDLPEAKLRAVNQALSGMRIGELKLESLAAFAVISFQTN